MTRVDNSIRVPQESVVSTAGEVEVLIDKKYERIKSITQIASGGAVHFISKDLRKTIKSQTDSCIDAAVPCSTLPLKLCIHQTSSNISTPLNQIIESSVEPVAKTVFKFSTDATVEALTAKIGAKSVDGIFPKIYSGISLAYRYFFPIR